MTNYFDSYMDGVRQTAILDNWKMNKLQQACRLRCLHTAQHLAQHVVQQVAQRNGYAQQFNATLPDMTIYVCGVTLLWFRRQNNGFPP